MAAKYIVEWTDSKGRPREDTFSSPIDAFRQAGEFSEHSGVEVRERGRGSYGLILCFDGKCTWSDDLLNETKRATHARKKRGGKICKFGINSRTGKCLKSRRKKR